MSPQPPAPTGDNQPEPSNSWQSQTQDEGRSFFNALFDFKFETFVSLKFIRILYIILIAVIVIFSVIFLIAALATGDVGPIIGAIVFVPLLALFYVVITRVYLEVIAVLFRIAENTSRMADKL